MIKILILILIIAGASSLSCALIPIPTNYTVNNRPRFASLTTVHPKGRNKDTLTIVSYNIKHAKKMDKAILLLREDPNFKDADILLLQEMTPVEVVRLADTLQYNYVFYPAIFHPRLQKDFGNAVLSKWPIIDDQKIILPHLKTYTRQRTATAAVIAVEEKKVAVISLHMGIFIKPDRREMLVREILEPLGQEALYIIVGGDFNSFTKKDRTHIRSSFQNENFQYATEGIGWTYKQWYLLNRRSTLDHIYTKGFEIISSGKNNDRSASDHIPIWAKIKFP